MRMLDSRLERIESELRFRVWVRDSRAFEAMSADELEAFAGTGNWPDRPEPAPGTCRLDTMDRASLIKLWKEDLQLFAGRSGDELEFFAIHGEWPGQNSDGRTGEKLAFDKLRVCWLSLKWRSDVLR